MSTSASDYNSSISPGPAYNAVAVTPSDSVGLAQTARGLYVGVSGDVKIDCPGGGSAAIECVSGRQPPGVPVFGGDTIGGGAA